ncbi:MAG: TraB/VirB10 family protein [Alphaproteobacteria bacterium]|nr:TraB/VirB10 family protein [Alphaproteobacteria bacterium]
MKMHLDAWRIWLKQRLALCIVCGLIIVVVSCVLVRDSDKEDEPKKEEILDQKAMVPHESLWLERFQQEIVRLEEALKRQQEEFQERYEQHHDHLMKVTRSLEDDVVAMRLQDTKVAEDTLPEKRNHISVQKVTRQNARKKPMIPAGAFMSAVMLSGLDAKASVGAMSDPHPVLMMTVGPIMLPGNQIMHDIKHCHVTGSGYGDISSERVYIRLEKMSCQHANGSMSDTTVAGYTVGGDGRAGVRGSMAMRAGKLLARGMWGGMLSGVAGILSKPSPVLLSTIGSPTEGVSYTNMFQQGLNKAGTSALDRLSNYYIERAEQMQPVVQVSSGQEVTLVVTASATIGENNVHKRMALDREQNAHTTIHEGGAVFDQGI